MYKHIQALALIITWKIIFIGGIDCGLYMVMLDRNVEVA